MWNCSFYLWYTSNSYPEDRIIESLWVFWGVLGCIASCILHKQILLAFQFLSAGMLVCLSSSSQTHPALLL